MTEPAVPLYDYQREWFLDRSRFKIGLWSRQVGKTFTTTLEIVDDVMTTSPSTHVYSGGIEYCLPHMFEYHGA